MDSKRSWITKSRLAKILGRCESLGERLSLPVSGYSVVSSAVFGAIATALLLFSPLASRAATGGTDYPIVLVVVGASGEAEFGRDFLHTAKLWQAASARAQAKCLTIGMDTNTATSDFDLLKQALATEPPDGSGELWLVLIGHGTFDGKETKFNLRGPDVAASDLAQWLTPLHRPVAVINCASCSAPFINALSAPGRVIVTATRSGSEQNYTRFGQYFAEALTHPESDLDKDGQVSLLEAFLAASYHTAEFYKNEGRLATEHALIDDNGDGRGTPPDWFRGVRAIKKAKDGAAHDGFRAHQFHLIRSPEEAQLPAALRTKRDALELAIAQLRETKTSLPETEYYQRLEALLLDLAHLYAKAPGTP